MSDSIINAATAFAKSRDTADLGGLSPWAIEDRMISFAKENAREGESTEAAVTRLSEEDDVMKSLARAAYWASINLQRTLSPADQKSAFRKHLGTSTEGEALTKRQELEETLDAVAKAEQREDETFYDAYDRLMKTDEQFAKAYVEYVDSKE